MEKAKIVASSYKWQYNENGILRGENMEFIREKIKEKPINKKRLLMKIGSATLSGVVFAVAACIVFAILMPIFSGYTGETAQITETETEVDTQSTENTQSQEPTSTIPSDISLSISDYQTLQSELYGIGTEINKSIVTVAGVSSDTEWLNNAYETEGQGSGVIISSDNNYLYILTEQKVINDATHIRVSFIDGASADATLLKHDGNTGIAILTVEKRLLGENTKKAISVAKMSDASSVKNGTIVIALGSPLGTNYSILTGNITSIDNKVETIDKNYSVLTTDIVASENGSGILINTNGEVVGVVIQEFSGSQDISTLTAVSISEVKDLIKNLCDGKDVTYVGLYVSTVTSQISDQYDIPKGVFIKQVVTDSPAMEAGLQSGDVITHVNGNAVNTDDGYSSKISALIPGTTCEVTVQRQNGNEYYEVKCVVSLSVFP